MFSLLARFQSLSVSVIDRLCVSSSLPKSFFALPVLTFFQLIGLWGAESDDTMGDGVRPFPAACLSLWLFLLVLLNIIDSHFLLQVFVLSHMIP